jgi:hypothetical protein
MPETPSLVFVIYARSYGRLELDEVFLQANAACEIHLITTDTVSYAAGGGCDGDRPGIVLHRFPDRAAITESALHELIERVQAGRGLPLRVVSLSESTVELAGRLNRQFGLVDRDYARFVHKDQMKREALAAGVRIPRFSVYDRGRFAAEGPAYLNDVIATIGLPCFVKPTSLYGGIGTRKLDTRQHLYSWALQSRGEELAYECDEYIDWPIYQCDSIVCGGATTFCQVSVGSRPWADIYHGHNVGIRTLAPEDPLRARLAAVAERVNAQFLQGQSGVTCLELFVRGDEVVFLEIGYRPAGAGMASSPYYRTSHQISLNDAHILAQVNPAWRPRPAFRYHVAWVVVPLPMVEGLLRRIVLPGLSCHAQTYWNVDAGQAVTANAGISRYAGAVLLWSEDYEQLTADYHRVLDECRLEVAVQHA